MTGDTPSQKHRFIMTPSIHFIKPVSSCSESVVWDKFSTLSIHSPFIASLPGSLVLQVTKSIPPSTISMAVSTSAPGTGLLLQPSQIRLQWTQIYPGHHPLQYRDNGLYFRVFCDPRVAGSLEDFSFFYRSDMAWFFA